MKTITIIGGGLGGCATTFKRKGSFCQIMVHAIQDNFWIESLNKTEGVFVTIKRLLNFIVFPKTGDV